MTFSCLSNNLESLSNEYASKSLIRMEIKLVVGSQNQVGKKHHSSTTDFEAYSLDKDSKLLDRHEKVIDKMHYEYLIDVPTIKENKHIIDDGMNVSNLRQLFAIDDVINGSYLTVIDELDEGEIYSRFISKKSLKLVTTNF